MLSKGPLQVHSVASRCVCMKCGRTPRIEAKGLDPVTITAHCCGETETRTVEKKELIFTQRFFGEGDDGGDGAAL